MKCNNTLYVIASYNCNLKCPHCSIRLQESKTDLAKIKNVILTQKFDECILFGGEPLIDYSIFNEIVKTGKLTGISTNLLLLNEDIAKALKCNNIMVATSWNKSRFTGSQYQLWHEKLKILDSISLRCTVLITLTNDLLDDEPAAVFNQIIAEIDKHPSVDEIKFEYLVDDNPAEYYSKCDDWLCKMHKCWNAKAKNDIVEQLKHGYIKNCHNVHTVTPDGTLHNGCPNSLCYAKYQFLSSCMSCEYSKICQPCILQKHCSFPKHLYKLIQEK